MFPTEIELQQHRADMEREARNHHLAQIARGEDEQPTLWARLREHFSATEPETPAATLPRKKTATV
jgi:hypothetical protein